MPSFTLLIDTKKYLPLTTLETKATAAGEPGFEKAKAMSAQQLTVRMLAQLAKSPFCNLKVCVWPKPEVFCFFVFAPQSIQAGRFCTDTHSTGFASYARHGFFYSTLLSVGTYR